MGFDSGMRVPRGASEDARRPFSLSFNELLRGMKDFVKDTGLRMIGAAFIGPGSQGQEEQHGEAQHGHVDEKSSRWRRRGWGHFFADFSFHEFLKNTLD